MTRPKTVARGAAGMGVTAAVSRSFGAIRVLVIAAVLGTTYLGNTFQGANQFSTVLFELLAAGALSAVLVPGFVRLLDGGDQPGAESLAGGILGVALLVMGVVAALGILAAPALAALLASGVEDPVIAAQQEELSTFLLRWFMPQLLLYAVGAVATAVLHARRSYAVPAAAPIANTVIMVGFLAWFRVLAGPDPGLDLDTTERWLLAAAGTLGVAGFVAVPTIALVRSGFRLRPGWRPHDATVRAALGLGGWATIQHASAAALLGAAIVVGGGVEGAVVAFQIGWFLFLAPYGIIAQPIQTAVLPELVGELGADGREAFGTSMRWSLETMAALLLPITAVFVALADPLADVLAFGASRTDDGIELIAAAVASLGLGLLAYGAYLLVARAYYAVGDSRTPAAASIVAAAAGVIWMVGVGRVSDGPRLVAGLGIGHTLAFTIAAVALLVGLSRRESVRLVSTRLLLPVAFAAVAGLLGRLALDAWAPDGRIQQLAALVVLGAAIGGSCLLAARQTGLLVARPGDTTGALA
jgi:putative peptidoglycan lipid II flippase